MNSFDAMELDEMENQLLDVSEQLLKLKEIVKNEETKQNNNEENEFNFDECDDSNKWITRNIEKLEKEKNSLEKEVRRLKSELEDERSISEALMQSSVLEREILQEENMAIRTLLNEKGLEIDELSKKLVETEEDANLKLNDLKKENSKHITNNKSIQEQNTKLKQQNQSVHQLKNVVGTLEKDKENLNKKLEKAEIERDENKMVVSSVALDSVQLKKINDRLTREIQIERNHANKNRQEKNDDVSLILRQISFFSNLLYRDPGNIEKIDPGRLCCVCQKPLVDALHSKHVDCAMCELLHRIVEVKTSHKHEVVPSKRIDIFKSMVLFKDRVLIILVAIISILLFFVLYK